MNRKTGVLLIDLVKILNENKNWNLIKNPIEIPVEKLPNKLFELQS